MKTNNNQDLNKLTNNLTAFATFEALMAAVRTGYAPTLHGSKQAATLAYAVNNQAALEGLEARAFVG